MILELREHRRVDRHRNGAGTKDAEECDEKVDTGRQHQGNAIRGRNVARDEAACDVARRTLAASSA